MSQKKFKVSIESTQSWVYQFVVESNSYQEAMQKAHKLYAAGEQSDDSWVDDEHFQVVCAEQLIDKPVTTKE